MTDLGQGAECLRPPDCEGKLSIGEFPEKLAIVFGTESSGCTQEVRVMLRTKLYISYVNVITRNLTAPTLSDAQRRR